MANERLTHLFAERVWATRRLVDYLNDQGQFWLGLRDLLSSEGQCLLMYPRHWQFKRVVLLDAQLTEDLEDFVCLTVGFVFCYGTVERTVHRDLVYPRAIDEVVPREASDLLRAWEDAHPGIIVTEEG